MKQLNIQKLFLVLIISMFTIGVSAQKRFLDEDFSADGLPIGWTTVSTSQLDAWQVSGGEASFVGTQKGSVTELITSAIDLTEGAVLSLNFRFMSDQYAGKVDTFNVYYRTSADGNWQRVLQNTTRVTAFTDKSFSIAEDDKTTEYQLKFEVINNLGAGVQLDDIYIEQGLSCTDKPTYFTVSSVSATAATLTWQVTKYAETTTIIIADAAIDDPSTLADDDSRIVEQSTINVVDVNNSFTTTAQLTDNTEYYAYVQSDCGGDDTSPWTTLSFTTPCLPITYVDGYTEGFEDGLGCWSSDGTGVGVNTSLSIEGQQSISLSNSSGTYTYISSPKFDFTSLSDVDVTDLYISFYAYTTIATTSTTNTAQISVGVTTDVADHTNYYREVKNITLTKSSEWQYIEVSFADYLGDDFGSIGNYISLRSGTGDKYNSISIDNIEVKNKKSCYAPQLLKVGNVGANEVELSWDAAVLSSSWDVWVSKTELDADDFASPIVSEIQTFSSNDVTVVGLSPNTTYYLYVKSGCGEWSSESVSILTPMIWTVPYTDDFNSYENTIPSTWFIGRYSLSTTEMTWTHRTDYTYLSSSFPSVSRDITAENSSLGGLVLPVEQSSLPYVIFPALECDAIQDIQFGFKGKFATTKEGIVVSVCTSQDVTTAVPVDTVYFQVSEDANGFQEFLVSFEDYVGSGKNIMLSPIFGVIPSVDNMCYFDDFYIQDLVDCGRVEQVFAEAGETSANITWNASGLPDGAEYEVGVFSGYITDFSNAEANQTYTTTSKNYQLTDLSVGTTYYIYVRPSKTDCPSAQWCKYPALFTTEYSMTLPYYEDFSAIGEAGATGAGKAAAYLTGWVLFNENSNSSYAPFCNGNSWTINNNSAEVPTSEYAWPALFFTTTTSSGGSYAVLPKFDPDVDLSRVYVQFLNLCRAASSELRLELGTMTDPTDASTFELIYDASVAAVKSAYRHYVELADFDVEGKYLAFRGYSVSANNMIDMDNLEIDYIKDCKPVTNLDTDNLASTSTDLTWKAGGDETEWMVNIYDYEVTTSTVETTKGNVVNDQSVTTTATYQATGLQASTQYWAIVQSVTPGCLSDATLMTFTTECAIATVPYTTNFDEFTTGYSQSPDCWKMKGNSYYNMPYVSGPSSWAPDYEQGADGGASIYYIGSAASYSYAILPELDTDLSTLQISFMAYKFGAGYNATFEIGIMDDMDDTFLDQTEYTASYPTSDNLFTLIESVTLTDAKEWKEVLVFLDSYQGSGKRIAIRSGGSVYSSFLIDNLAVTVMPSCTKIADVSASTIASTSVKLQWTADQEVNWDIKISTAEIDPSEDNADLAFDAQVSSRPYTVTGLEPNTTYYAYVRRVCDEATSSVGEWSESYAFTTYCAAVTPGSYAEDFESFTSVGDSEPIGCFIASGTNTSLSYLVNHSTTVTGLESTDANKNCLKMCNTANNTSIVALPEIDIDDISDCKITFKAYTRSSTSNTYIGGQFEVGVMTDPTSTSTFQAVYGDTILNYTETNDEWTEYTVDFKDYTGDMYNRKGSYIAIKALPGQLKTDASVASYNYIYIDDIRVEPYGIECSKPTSVNITNIKDNSIDLSWYQSSATSHRVVLSSYADRESNHILVDTLITTTANSAIIENLPASTNMYLYMQSICEDGTETEWSTPQALRTSGCNTSIPYFESFEGLPSGSQFETLFSCMSYLYCQPYVSYYEDPSLSTKWNSSFSDVSGVYSLLLPWKTLVILPVEGVANAVMELDIITAYTSEYFVVGVIKDPTDLTTFVPLDTFNLSYTSTMYTYSINLEDYDDIAMSDHIAIMASNALNWGYELYVDNITINSTSALWAPSSLETTKVEDTKATVAWAQIGMPDSYEVAITPAGGDEVVYTVENSGESTYEFTNLTTATSYSVRVRAVQDSEVSEWSESLVFTTLSDPKEAPYTEEFAVDADNTQWIFVNSDGTDNSWIISDAVAYGDGDNNSIYISNNGQDYAYSKDVYSYSWAYRTVEITEPSIYDVSFMAKCPGNGTSADYLNAYFLPASYIDFSGENCYDIVTGELLATTLETNPYMVTEKMRGNTDWTLTTAQIRIDEPGFYNILLQTVNTNYTATENPLAAVDNIVIEEATCADPYDFVATVLDTAITMRWNGNVSSKWEVKVSTSDVDVTAVDDLGNSALVYSEIVTTDEGVTAEGLTPSLGYYIYLRTICDDDSKGEYQKYYTKTSSLMKTLPFEEDFGGTKYEDGKSAEYIGWTATDDKVVTSTYVHSLTTSSDTTLLIPANSYVALPLFNREISEMQITYEIGMYTIQNEDKEATVEVGIMNDPYDISTFESMYTYVLETSSSNTQLEFEKFYHRFNQYTGDGRYIAFKATAKYANYTKIYLDDVVVEVIPSCVQPTDLVITENDGETAQLSFEPFDDSEYTWRVVAVNKEMTDSELDAITTTSDNCMFDGTTTSPSIQLTDLPYSTKLYVYVKTICTDGNEWSVPVVFTTPIAPETIPYIETFVDIEDDALPLLWTRSDVSYESVLAGGELSSVDYSYDYDDFACQTESGESGSPVLFNDIYFSSYSDKYYWVVGPQVNVDVDAVFTFDFKAEPNTSYINYPTSVVTENRQSFVRLFISTDDGETWLTENSILIGDADTADYKFDDYFQEWGKLSMDLTKYKGDTIRFAFYSEINDKTYLDFYFDNIKINCAEYYTFTDEVNEYTDYSGYGFDLSYDQVFGDSLELVRYSTDLSADGSGCDSIITLKLDINGKAYTNITEYICESDLFTGHGLTDVPVGEYLMRGVTTTGVDSLTTINVVMDLGDIVTVNDTICDGGAVEFGELTITMAGVYEQTFANVNGCDSVVTLTMFVNNIDTVAIENQSICPGDVYEYNNKEFTDEGTYYETFISEVTGCDSVVTFTISHLATDLTDISKSVCEGVSIEFAGMTITESGIYTDTLANVNGCDSVIRLTFTTLVSGTVIEETDTICNGDVRIFNDMNLTAAGIYRDTLTSDNGCESYIELTLIVLATDTTNLSETICEGDVFEFYGETITVAGAYTHIDVNANGCDSVINLSLNVLNGSVSYVEKTICSGDVYEFNGVQYSEPGEYQIVDVNTNGCDSVINFELIVQEIDTTYVADTIALSDLPYTHLDKVYDENTEVGDYTDEFTVNNGTECPDIEIYTLTVIQGDVAVETTRILDLTIYPNPLAAGATLYVDAEFTAEERDGMVVEVMNIVGQRIISERPTTDDITINGLTQSGVYIVNITTGTGVKYQGKVIVR